MKKNMSDCKTPTIMLAKVGRKTEMLARFPTVAGELVVADRSDHRVMTQLSQPCALLRLMDAGQKKRLWQNIAEATNGTPPFIAARQLAHFDKADPIYDTSVCVRVSRN